MSSQHPEQRSNRHRGTRLTPGHREVGSGTARLPADGVGRVAMTMSGDMTETGAAVFLDRLRQAMTPSTSRVVVDMEQVTAIDSNGCCALVAGLREARVAGVCVALNGDMTPAIRRIVDVCSFLALFDAH